jgi:hypothetical protein
MRIDDLSGELEAFTDRARNVLDWEVKKARNVVSALNAEKAATQKALTELQGQYEEGQKQLKAILDTLHKGTALAGSTTKSRRRGRRSRS